MFFKGNIYDVSSGSKYYAPGGSYAFFTGKDSSRAFSTGDFTNDLNDQIDDLNEQQVSDIFNWKKNFDEKYIFLGHLEGAFYHADGKKTQSLSEAENKFKIHQKVILLEHFLLRILMLYLLPFSLCEFNRRSKIMSR